MQEEIPEIPRGFAIWRKGLRNTFWGKTYEIFKKIPYLKNSYNYSNLSESQILIYLYQQHIVPDQYEVNPSIHHGGMRKDGLKARQTDG